MGDHPGQLPKWAVQGTEDLCFSPCCEGPVHSVAYGIGHLPLTMREGFASVLRVWIMQVNFTCIGMVPQDPSTDTHSPSSRFETDCSVRGRWSIRRPTSESNATGMRLHGEQPCCRSGHHLWTFLRKRAHRLLRVHEVHGYKFANFVCCVDGKRRHVTTINRTCPKIV